MQYMMLSKIYEQIVQYMLCKMSQDNEEIKGEEK